MLLPAFVDSHIHPDKTIMGMEYRHDYKETDLLSIIEADRALRWKSGQPDHCKEWKGCLWDVIPV